MEVCLFQAKMMQARALTTLAGANGHRFASWLLPKTKPALAAVTTRSYNVPAASEPFLNGSSTTYVEDMYNAWLADPSSVHTVSDQVL